jgi:hypothetical protein
MDAAWVSSRISARLHEQLLPVDDADARLLEGEQHRQFDHVDAERLVGDAELLELALDLLRDSLGDLGIGAECATQRRDAGTGAGLEPGARRALVRGVRIGVHLGGGHVEPRVVQRVVLGRGAEVPRDRVAVARQQTEPDELVHRPGADVGRCHVPDVGEVEGEHGSHLRGFQLGLQPREALGAEPVEVDALLPVDRIGARGAGALHRDPPESVCRYWR